MIARTLMFISAGIVFMLGAIHLFYTLRGPLLTPRDPALLASMQQVSPVITRETTMWRAWLGFNSTHSMALLLFGLIYAYLALAQAPLLFHSPFLLGLGFVTLAGFLVLARAYFFSAPVIGISVCALCYGAAVAFAWLGPG